MSLHLAGLNIALGMPQSQWIVGPCDHEVFHHFSKGHWQSLCTAITAGKCLQLRLCKGTVKESIHVGNWPIYPIIPCNMWNMSQTICTLFALGCVLLQLSNHQFYRDPSLAMHQSYDCHSTSAVSIMPSQITSNSTACETACQGFQ